MAKYKNKYRIESTRLKGWDYRNPGAYFITICTHNRRHFFGECRNGKMKFSTAGAIAQGFWFEIPKHNDHVQLGEFVVMPNHVHGILILSEMDEMVDGDGGDGKDGDDGNGGGIAVETLNFNVSTTTTTTDKTNKIDKTTNETKTNKTDEPTNEPTTDKTNEPTNETSRKEFFRKISPKSGSVSRIIQQYERICKIHINRSFPDMNFSWQGGFHDHIIRNEQSFKRISRYIINNPKNWKEDNFFGKI